MHTLKYELLCCFVAATGIAAEPAYTENNGTPAFETDSGSDADTDADADTLDGVHPYTDSGTEKIVNNRHDALLPFFP